jgi:predicted ester cyclase
MRNQTRVTTLVLSALALMIPFSASAQSMPATRVDSLVIDRWLEMYNKADVSQADEVLSPDFVPHMPAAYGVVDRTSYLAAIVNTNVLYAHVTLQDLFGRDDMLVGRFTIRAVWPPNLPYTNTAIVFFRVEGGRIAEEWWETDLLGVLEQVGQLPMTRSVYSWSSPSLGAGMPGIPPLNSYLARLSLEAINTGNLSLLHRLLSRDYKNHDVVAPYADDSVAYESFLRDVMLTAFPDLHITIDDVVAIGDRVALRCTVTGTHQGPFGPLPPTGRQVRWTSMVIYRFADNKIVDGWWAYDALALMQLMTQ